MQLHFRTDTKIQNVKVYKARNVKKKKGFYINLGLKKLKKPSLLRNQLHQKNLKRTLNTQQYYYQVSNSIQAWKLLIYTSNKKKIYNYFFLGLKINPFVPNAPFL